jgi:hypothetical protein
MLTLQGTFRGVVSVPAFTNRKTGEIRPAFSQVQVEARTPMGKLELFTFYVDDASAWEGKADGDAVSVHVRPDWTAKTLRLAA